MIRKNNSTGKIGENYAVKILKKKKFKIIEQNFHSRFGEIDIIAKKDKYLVFIEVKTRDKNAIYDPVYAVTTSKIQKIVKTAKYYLLVNKNDLQPRFDVFTIVTENEIPITFNHIENAFGG